MSHPDQAHVQPRHIERPAAARRSQASPRRGLAEIVGGAAQNVLPDRTERVPVTDDTVASYFAGLATGRMSERSLLATFGYRTGTAEYDAAKERLTDIAMRFRAAGAIKIIVERGVPIMEKGDPDELERFVTQRPAGVSTNPTRIIPPEARRVDQALARHAEKVTPPQSDTPTTGAK